MVNVISVLSSPLQKIQAATEASTKALNIISEVILTMNTAVMEISSELKKQTGILTDIKTILIQQNKSLEKGTSAKGGPAGKGFSPMSAKDVGLTALMILGIAGAIVASAALFSLIPSVSPMQLLVALAVAVILIPVAFAYSLILKATAGLTIPQLIFSAIAVPLMALGILATAYIFTMMPSNPSAPDPIWVLKAVLAIGLFAIGFYLIMSAIKGATTKELIFGAIAIPLIALGIVGTAYVFMMFPSNPSAPDPIWVLKAALAIGLYAIGFYFIMKAIKGATTKELIFGALAIPLIALGIVGTAYVFMMFPSDPSAPDPIWVLKAALAIGLFAIGFYLIMKGIKGASLKELIFSALAIPLIAVGILATAWVFQGLSAIGEYNAPDPMWTLKAGFSLIVFSIPFWIVSKAVKGMSIKELLFMAVAIPIVAFGVLATAWIFQGLSGIEYNAPEPEWSVKAGVSVVIFGAVLWLSSKTIGKLGMTDLFKGLIGLVVASFAIIAVGWILSFGPSKWLSPPIEWSKNTAIALGVIGVAIVAMGLAVMAMTPVTLLLGALGIIVAAITILAVGWILSGLGSVMPKLVAVAKGFTKILLAPINGMVSVFSRFKDEIGIENMVGLAVGIAALGGAWLIFVAAMAGSSIASGVGNAIGGLLDGIGSLFGGDQPSPIVILERLARIGPKLEKLAKPLIKVGRGFSMINMSAGGAMRAFTSLIEFHDGIDADDFDSQATTLSSIGVSLKGIVPTLKRLTLPLRNIRNSFSSINTSSSGVVKSFTSLVDMHDGVDVNRFSMQARSLESISKSYTKIAYASKTMNIKAINATTEMFKQLDDLAKNGGEDAMTVLAEKLMVAVHELSGTVAQLNAALKKQETGSKSLGKALAGAVEAAVQSIKGASDTVKAADGKNKTVDWSGLIAKVTTISEAYDSGALKVTSKETSGDPVYF